MLVKLLSARDGTHFIQLAELLSIADKPLLWDGKKNEDVTQQTDMKNVAFAKGEAESRLLSDWAKEVRNGSLTVEVRKQRVIVRRPEDDDYPNATDVEKLLLEQLKNVPLQKNTESSVERLNAVSAVLHRLIKVGPPAAHYAVRIMLYELMLMALASGGITGIEYRFLEILKHHHQVNDCDFDEILERAEAMYREIQKSIALVLE